MTRLQSGISCTIILCQFFAHGQPEIRNDKIYHFQVFLEIPLSHCDVLGHTAENKSILIAEPGAIFTVIGKKEDDSLIIRFWKWENNSYLNSIFCFSDSAALERKYFLMAECMLKNANPRYDNKIYFTAGNVLIPVKMRLNKFDFSKDFTLGPVAGIKMRLSHYTRNCINFLFGLGVTSITLNDKSTDGHIEDDTEIPALSPCLGMVFDFFNQTQAGLFVGWDFISNNENVNFIYNGKMWVSFGLGFSILTRGSPAAVKEDEINEGD
jgi:hypothetical protein